MIGDWIDEHLGGIIVVSIVVVATLFVWAIVQGNREMDAKCNHWMEMARSPHDSLEVSIACERMVSDRDRNIAIGAAAGAAASAAASRR